MSTKNALLSDGGWGEYSTLPAQLKGFSSQRAEIGDGKQPQIVHQSETDQRIAVCRCAVRMTPRPSESRLRPLLTTRYPSVTLGTNAAGLPWLR